MKLQERHRVVIWKRYMETKFFEFTNSNNNRELFANSYLKEDSMISKTVTIHICDQKVPPLTSKTYSYLNKNGRYETQRQ